MLLDPNSWLVICKTLYGSQPFLFKLSKALFMHSQSEHSHGAVALEDHTEGPEIVHFILGKVCMCKDEAFGRTFCYLRNRHVLDKKAFQSFEEGF